MIGCSYFPNNDNCRILHFILSNQFDNGKSPTMAKRLRQLFESVLPETIDELLDNIHEYRKYLTGDFESKVIELNKLTKNIIAKKVIENE